MVPFDANFCASATFTSVVEVEAAKRETDRFCVESKELDEEVRGTGKEICRVEDFGTVDGRSQVIRKAEEDRG